MKDDTCQLITCTLWCWTMFLAAGGVQATRTFDFRHANSVSISERTALPQLTLERPLLLFGTRRPQGKTIALHIRGGSNWGGDDDDGGGSYPEEDESRDNYQEYGDNARTPPNDRYGSASYQENDYYYNGSSNSRDRSKGYYDDDGYYREDDPQQGAYRSSSTTRRSSLNDVGSSISSFSNHMPDMIRYGNKKVGLTLLAAGGVLTFLGIMMLFNKFLLRLGNFLLIAGVPMTIGPGKTAGYFLQPKKARATGCLFTGIFLVVIGWARIGIALEIFGLLNLFGNMFPFLMVFLKQMPIVGTILKSGSNGSSNNKKQRGSRYQNEDNDYQQQGGQDDYYYGDQGGRDDEGYY